MRIRYRQLKREQREHIRCVKGTCWQYPERELDTYKNWAGRIRKRYNKTHLDYEDVLKRRFKPATCQVRCINKLHKISLTDKGKLVLHGHPNLQAELMLGFMAKDCRCLNVLKAWQSGEINKLPDELKWGAKGGRITRRALNRNVGVKPDGLSIISSLKNDFQCWYTVDSDSFIFKAFVKALTKCLKQIGAWDDMNQGGKVKRIVTDWLDIYRDVAVNPTQLKMQRNYHKPALSFDIYDDQLQINGTMCLSWLSSYKQGQVVTEDGRLFLGVDADNKEYYLVRDNDGDWNAKAK